MKRRTSALPGAAARRVFELYRPRVEQLEDRLPPGQLWSLLGTPGPDVALAAPKPWAVPPSPALVVAPAQRMGPFQVASALRDQDTFASTWEWQGQSGGVLGADRMSFDEATQRGGLSQGGAAAEYTTPPA